MRSALVLLMLLVSAPAWAGEISRCVLIIDDKSYIDGPCEFSRLEGGDFQISNGTAFAYVYPSEKPVIGYWNGPERASHAHEPLGELTQNGACWRNEHSIVCAYQ